MTELPDSRTPADPALAPAPPVDARRLRPAVERLRDLGFQSVQLDATLPGLGPRDLGPSARRDLVSTLRRRGMRPAGLDALVPVAVWTDAAHVDAAVSAVAAVIELAADLDRCPVSVRFPDPPPSSASSAVPTARSVVESGLAPGGLIVPPGVLAGSSTTTAAASPDAAAEAISDDPAAPAIAALLAVAEREGVSLVDFGVSAAARGLAGPAPGVDLAACLVAGADPVAVAAADLDRLAALRLSDLTPDGRRVPPGDPEGRADLAALAGLIVLSARPRPVVLDPRQWADPWGGLVAVAARWAEVTA